jgi:rhodanese-related sulfurtransferase
MGERFNRLTAEARQRVRELSPQELQARLEQGEKLCVIDVREESEWNQGHLPGAIHLGKGVIERDIEKQVPDAHAELVLYCGGGSRSALAAENVQKMGYDRVLSLQGGLRGWQQAGLPVEKP